MFRGRNVLAIVAGRGGSKGLPQKNVLPCGGRPLVQWSVLAAKSSHTVDQIVATSDDERILTCAEEVGARPMRRPAELATDAASMADVVRHALDTNDLSDDAFAVLLQATSPLRTGADIDGAFALLDKSGSDSVVSVVLNAKSPAWMTILDEEARMRPVAPELASLARRQEVTQAYVYNGAVYAFAVGWFRRTMRFVDSDTRAYVMPADRSIDIDTELDFELANLLLSRR